MEKRNISFIQNLSISYECALAIGNSLELEKMLYEVIHKIAHKTNAHRGSIWLCNGKKGKRIILGARAGSKLSGQEIKKREVFYFDVFEKICAAKKPVIKNRSEKDFNKYCIDVTGKEQVVLIIPIDKIAIIHLVYTDKEIVDKTLINMLTGLSPKLVVAIEACKAYENLLKEIQGRKETEDELKKKTAQLSNGEKKLQKLYKESEDSRKSLISIMEDVVEKENALRDSKEKYRDLTENMYDIVYSIDINGNLTYISPQIKRYGFEPEDILLKNLIEIIHPDDREKTIEEFKKTIEVSAEFPSIFRINDASEQTFWFEDIGKVQYDKDGNITGIAGVLRDITDRKQTEDLIHIQRDLALKLNEVKGLDETLRLSLDYAIKISKMDCGGIYLVNKSTGNIDLAYHKGLPADFVKSASHFNADSQNAILIKKGKPVYSKHKKLDVDINVARDKENLLAIAVIPILYEGKVIACLNIASHTLDEVPSFAREALQTISAQIGSVIARLNTREELQASEEKYRQVVDNSLIGIYITQNHILKYCNQRFAEIFGYKNSNELLGKSIKNLVTPESWDLVYNEVKLRESGEKETSRYEFKGIKKYGGKIDIEVLGGRILFLGKPAIQGTLLDITERKKAALELKSSEERYRVLANAASEAVFISENGYCIDTNQTACNMFGYSYEELIGIFGTDIIAPESKELVKNHMLSGYEEPYEALAIKKDRKIFPAMFQGRMFEYKGKKVRLTTCRDLTKQKKHEQELIYALEKAKESDRLKSVFLTTMSHELRTPLNAVIGFSELIDESLPIDVITDFAETINDSGTHLLNIIEDIFDISTLETGDMKVIKEEFSIKKVIKEISDSIKAEQKKEKKECLNIYFCSDNKVQDTIIYTDRQKLKQIMINLLKNATKFTLEGHIEYGYEIEDEKNILFFVKDTGVGIPKDKQEIIFDRFRQGDDSFTRKFGGTGLGLAIVKHLVEILGGKIWLSSETDKGSEFYFTLPCNIAADSIKKPPETDITKTGIDLSGKVILVVDDVKSIYQYLKAILRKTNVRLIWAKDGQEAIDICKENRNIDLVLMDIQMPVLNGFEATKHIKQFRKDLPIIAQTAYALKGDREMSLNAGCDDYITKPIDAKVLFTTIEKYI